MFKTERLKWEGHLQVIRLMSVAFTEPRVELKEVLEKISDWYDILYPGHAGLTKEMINACPDLETSLLELKVQHTKVFIGPSDIYTPPYASFYLDSQHKMMTDYSLDTIRLFHKLGMKPSQDDFPDHLVYELELLYLLGMRCGEESGSCFIEPSASFIENHTIPWLELFYQNMVEKKVFIFYTLLLKMTLICIHGFSEMLSKLRLESEVLSSTI